MPTTRLPRRYRMQSLPRRTHAALAEQGARLRAVAPDRQDHVDHGRRNRRGLSRSQRGARPDRDAHRDGVAARDGAVDAVAYALRCAVDLPGNGGAGQHRRYADHRPAHRRNERQPPSERAVLVVAPVGDLLSQARNDAVPGFAAAWTIPPFPTAIVLPVANRLSVDITLARANEAQSCGWAHPGADSACGAPGTTQPGSRADTTAQQARRNERRA